MNSLHYEFDLAADDVVEVTLKGNANVRLLDPANYARYRRGEKHRDYGGLARVSPVEIPAPSTGHGHVVVDLGGYGGTVRPSARVLKGAA